MDHWVKYPHEDEFVLTEHRSPRIAYAVSMYFSAEATTVPCLEMRTLERFKLVSGRPLNVYASSYRCALYASAECLSDVLRVLERIGPLLDLLDRLREELRL